MGIQFGNNVRVKCYLIYVKVKTYAFCREIMSDSMSQLFMLMPCIVVVCFTVL